MLRRQAPRRAAPCHRQGRQTASASSGRLAPWLRSTLGPFVTARAPPRRPSPRKTGPRACGSAAGYAVPGSSAAGCFATGSAASAGLGSLRCRLRGATGRLGLRPACRAPARRCALMRAIPGALPSGALRASKSAPGGFVPPPIVCGFGKGPVRPTQPGSVVGNGT